MKLFITLFALSLGIASTSFANDTLIIEQYPNTTLCKNPAGETLTITKSKVLTVDEIFVDAQLTTANHTETFSGEYANGKYIMFDELNQPVNLVVHAVVNHVGCRTRLGCIDERQWTHAGLTLASGQILNFSCDN